MRLIKQITAVTSNLKRFWAILNRFARCFFGNLVSAESPFTSYLRKLVVVAAAEAVGIHDFPHGDSRLYGKDAMQSEHKKR